MLTLLLLSALGLAVVAIILAETRTGTLRWQLGEAGRRISALEDETRILAAQVTHLRTGRAEGGVPMGPAPAPTADTAPVEPRPSETAVPTTRAEAGMAAPAPDMAISTPGSVPTVPSLPPGNGPPIAAPLPSLSASVRRASLEERLGTRWAVWVGGLALALGGILLVRYSIEQGFFGPGMRILMGLSFAGLLIGGGEWLRRSGHKPALDALPQAHIPSILTAAGSMSLFGTVYAAHALYGFIGPAAAFVLLGAVGVLTMLAAALHGPALAGLGLVGAYVAPMLVASAKPSPWPLVLYFGVVAAAAMGLAHLRSWLWLAAVAVGGAVLWGIALIEPILHRSHEWTLAGYLHTTIQLVLVAVTFGLLAHGATRDQDARPDPIGKIALAVLATLVALMLGAGRYELASTVPFTLAASGILLATAWKSPRVSAAAVLAGFVVLVSLAVWPGLKTTTDTSHLLREVAGVLLVPENVTSYLMFAGIAAVAVMAVASFRLMRGQALPASTAGFFALAATATPLLALILTYLRVTQFDSSISFAFAAGMLALMFAFLTERFQRSEIAELPGTRLATGAFAAAALAALSLGLVAALSRGYLTVALALAALGAAYIADRRDIPLLRHVVTTLAAIVLARLAWEPRIMGTSVGSWPIVNWLLAGYGIPAVAFFLAGRLMERRGADVAARLADAAAVLLAGLLCCFEIRHLLNDGDILAPASGHIEMGLLALVGFGLSFAAMRLDLGRANPVFHVASIAFGCLAGLTILAGLGVRYNPLFTPDPVTGRVVFSSLALGYLLPGLAAVLLARAARPWRPRWYVTGIAILAVLLIVAYVTLEIRHAFQGPIIVGWRRTTSPEWWSYSAGWLWLGLVFLAYGIFRGSIEARLASAALVLLAVVKVFLFDLAGLSGLWRALSFIMLGVVLIGIGLAYQHLVFGQQARPAPPAEPTPAA